MQLLTAHGTASAFCFSSSPSGVSFRNSLRSLFSGGERQRISIARALLRKTPVLFADEAAASLDAETSFEVLDAILKLGGYTRIIVTHDLGENILRRCTGLFALENGMVSEQGSFSGLMDQKGYFYSLYTVAQGE